MYKIIRPYDQKRQPTDQFRVVHESSAIIRSGYYAQDFSDVFSTRAEAEAFLSARLGEADLTSTSEEPALAPEGTPSDDKPAKSRRKSGKTIEVPDVTPEEAQAALRGGEDF